jgi:hypothetical protein
MPGSSLFIERRRRQAGAENAEMQEGLRADALNACRGARRASLHEEWRIHWLAAKQKP